MPFSDKQERQHQAQKHEAVGRLAGGIAHDFNNLLTGILAYADFALESLPPGSPARADIEEIRRGGERARDLTARLLAFSRRRVLQLQVLDLAEVVSDFERLLRPVIGEHIDLAIHAEKGIAKVEADPGQIEQIIMNLAANARDAMPQGGSLVMRTGLVEVTPPQASRYPYAVKPGHYALLEVSDTGVGIDPEVQQHMFEPFYTTKEQGKGTGLGLATIYSITKRAGGFIEVESEPPGGTTFRIYLPAVEKELSSRLVCPAPTRPSHEMKVILLVEDDEMVRSVASRILKRDGYAVLEARTPSEALDELVAEHCDEIALILTDIVLPEMSGRQLAERAQGLLPGVQTLFMSGYTEDEVMRRGVATQGMRFLEKPFTPHELLASVREALDGGAS